MFSLLLPAVWLFQEDRRRALEAGVMSLDSVLVEAQSQLLFLLLGSTQEKKRRDRSHTKEGYDKLVARAQAVRNAWIAGCKADSRRVRTLRFSITSAKAQANLSDTEVRVRTEVIPPGLQEHEEQQPPALGGFVEKALRETVHEELVGVLTRAGRRIHIQDAWTCSERLYLLRDRFVAPSGSSLLWDVVVPSRVIIVLPRGLLALSNTDLDSPPLVGNPQVGLEPSFESAVDPTITLASVLQLVERKHAALGLTLIEIREWEAGPAGAIEMLWTEASGGVGSSGRRYLLVAQDELGFVVPVSRRCLDAAGDTKTTGFAGLHRVSSSPSVQLSPGAFITVDRSLTLVPARTEAGLLVFKWGNKFLSRALRSSSHPSPGLALIACVEAELAGNAVVTLDGAFCLATSCWTGDAFPVCLDRSTLRMSPLCPVVRRPVQSAEDAIQLRRKDGESVVMEVQMDTKGGYVVVLNVESDLRVCLGAFPIGRPILSVPGSTIVNVGQGHVRVDIATGGFVYQKTTLPTPSVNGPGGAGGGGSGKPISRRNGVCVDYSLRVRAVQAGIVRDIDDEWAAESLMTAATTRAEEWLVVDGGGVLVERVGQHHLFILVGHSLYRLQPPLPGDMKWSPAAHEQERKALSHKRTTQSQWGRVDSWIRPEYQVAFKRVMEQLTLSAGTAVRRLPALLHREAEVQWRSVCDAQPGSRLFLSGGSGQSFDQVLRPFVQAAVQSRYDVTCQLIHLCLCMQVGSRWLLCASVFFCVSVSHSSSSCSLLMLSLLIFSTSLFFFFLLPSFSPSSFIRGHFLSFLHFLLRPLRPPSLLLVLLLLALHCLLVLC